MDFDEFLKKIKDFVPPRGPFAPFWFYNEPGDMIEVYLSNEAYLAEWVNKDVTVLYSIGLPKKVVGVQIHGIKKGLK